MLLSRTEVFAFVVGIVIVVVMGIITFTGPYHHINRVVAKSQFPTMHVQIVTDPKTIGRYTPASITVHVNEPVVFANNSNADHTVTDRKNAFNSGNIATTKSWTFVPKKAGTFHYYCIYHPFMHGTLIVKP